MAQLPTTSNPDLIIQETVTAALHQLTEVRETHAPLEVNVKDGVVTVKGVVFAPRMRREILFAAATVPGVQKVINLISDDDALELAAAQALSANPQIEAPSRINVNSYLGVIALTGQITGEKERAAVIQAILEIPGVRQVVDQLQVSETT